MLYPSNFITAFGFKTRVKALTLAKKHDDMCNRFNIAPSWTDRQDKCTDRNAIALSAGLKLKHHTIKLNQLTQISGSHKISLHSAEHGSVLYAFIQTFAIAVANSAQTFGYIKKTGYPTGIETATGYPCGSYFVVATCKYCYIVPRCVGGCTTMQNNCLLQEDM